MQGHLIDHLESGLGYEERPLNASPDFGIAGAPLALVGVMLFENAYVQAGQSVPLA